MVLSFIHMGTTICIHTDRIKNERYTTCLFLIKPISLQKRKRISRFQDIRTVTTDVKNKKIGRIKYYSSSWMQMLVLFAKITVMESKMIHLNF